jgi:hypothetical protein
MMPDPDAQRDEMLYLQSLAKEHNADIDDDKTIYCACGHTMNKEELEHVGVCRECR